MKKSIVLSIFLLCACEAISQINFDGEASIQGLYATKEELPFWFYNNNYGRISENTRITGLLSGAISDSFRDNSSFEIMASLNFQDGIGDKIFIDEAYIKYEREWLELIVGAKHQQEFYSGLSASNSNILLSDNARPVPGIKIETKRPIFFGRSDGGFGFLAKWGEYFLGDHLLEKNVRLHNKSFHLVYKSWNGWQLKAGIQHYAEWGGVSPRFGPQPGGFIDYLRIFTGRAGGGNASEADKANALGNHLGSWEFYIKRSFDKFSAQFIFNSVFEDGSGSRGANFPDGKYGIYIESENKRKLVNSFLYEFYYTRDQSGTGPHLYDNYFNSGIYPSGWTYKNRVLGVPFFTYNPHLNYIVNNKFMAHHIGFAGQFSTRFETFPYKIMASFSHNEGTYTRPLHLDGTNEDVMYVFSEFKFLNVPLDVKLQIGAEFNSFYDPIFGGGLKVSKSF